MTEDWQRKMVDAYFLLEKESQDVSARRLIGATRKAGAKFADRKAYDLAVQIRAARSIRFDYTIGQTQ